MLIKAFGLDKSSQTKNLIEVQDVPASHWAFNNVQVVLKLAL